jgi:uncharacterized membrane protein YczE
MKNIFTVKQVPRLEWSSETPFNLQPRLITFFYLNLGLVLFGLGESLLIASGAGVSPWTVLAQGIAGKADWSIGFTTMIVSFAILLLWVPLKQKPGMGTILNALIIAANLGAGPRDGLMTGLQVATGQPIAKIRIGIEVTVVAIGWYLGGVVGAGTLIFAFGVGPCVAVGILFVRRFL